MLYNILKSIVLNTIAIVGNITAHHDGKNNVCAVCVSSTNDYIMYTCGGRQSMLLCFRPIKAH